MGSRVLIGIFSFTWSNRAISEPRGAPVLHFFPSRGNHGEARRTRERPGSSANRALEHRGSAVPVALTGAASPRARHRVSLVLTEMAAPPPTVPSSRANPAGTEPPDSHRPSRVRRNRLRNLALAIFFFILGFIGLLI